MESVVFSEIIDLDDIEITELFDVLYDYFCEDFIDNKTYLNANIYINPKSNQKDDGKELVFWHLTTRETKIQKKVGNRWVVEKERLPDYRRSERLAWIKKIIENHSHKKIKLFYYKENTNQIRLYLWAFDEDFIVILEKLGKSSSYLVTSFYVDKNYNRATYHKRYDDYINKKDKNLENCEWF